MNKYEKCVWHIFAVHLCAWYFEQEILEKSDVYFYIFRCDVLALVCSYRTSLKPTLYDYINRSCFSGQLMGECATNSGQWFSH